MVIQQYPRVGECSVSVSITGHNKLRFTVTIAAMADGRKLKPYMVFKGVCTIAEVTRVPGMVVALIQWVNSVWGCLSFQCQLFVWDAYW